ncbi:glycosyltransferase family protein [Vallitalea guaymasensis]|uniref:Glycosyltransferase family 8 protein n=1 Tax=Vallitalea guaymasensis TaxID=1185412 RepID=A0A8J8MAC4_9FIRM|nr:hypothetical protein [Vallitalea guaymasensis]QUH29311.1 hypothetical protein HYG85_10380 [Vallitalea guaymasensis]
MKDEHVMKMTRQDGSRKYAFVTFLMMNDHFLPGILMQGNQLRKGNYGADLVCLVTENISQEAKDIIGEIYDYVVDVEEVFIHHRRRQKRQDRPYLFTRFQALRLGIDGDLGFDYEKVVVLDADVLPRKNYNQLFALDTPAGTVNERKGYTMEYSNDGKYIIPPNVKTTKKWIWHRTYDSMCPHGENVPVDICHRVIDDPSNMGINSSLWVLTPSMDDYHEIMEDVNRPEIKKLIGDIFNWPEMQYATIHWAGRWKNIDLIFNGFGGYPSIDILYGLHYAGFKPWNFKDKKKIYRLGKKKDFLYWYKTYIEMVTKDYPSFLEYKKLKNLLDCINDFLRSEGLDLANTKGG